MWESKLDKQKSLIGLLIIIAIALCLRFISMGRDSLWFDEAISYLTANLSITEIINNTIKDPHPPLYYLFLHYWLRLVPDNDMAVRFLGTILNLLLIPLTFFLAFDLLKRYSLALISAFIIAISPFQIAYSHELRMYSLLMLLTTFLIWSYWRASNNGKWYWWLLFFLTALLSIYTHLFSFFVLAGIGIYAIINHRNRRSLIMTITVGLALAILFIPWLAILAGESQYDLGSFRPLHSVSNNPVKLIAAFTFLLFGHSTVLWYSGLAMFLAVTIIVIAILELRRSRHEDSRQPITYLVVLILCIICIPVIIFHLRPFFLPERTLAAAAPLLSILLSWALTRRQSPLPYLVGATMLVMVVGSFMYLFDNPQKPPYREAIQFVAQNHKDGDVILHTSDGSYLPALRYVTLPNHVVLTGDPDPRKPLSVYEAFGGNVWDRETAVTADSRLWLIVALEHSVEWQQEQAQYFTDTYPLIEEQDFSGIKLYLYELPEQQ